MSTSPSSYLNNIGPQSQEYPLAQQILSKITQAASTVNVPSANAARKELPSLFAQFLNTQIESGRFSASTLLALVAAATAAGGKTLTDIGVLGTVTVSGSSITFAAGAY